MPFPVKGCCVSLCNHLSQPRVRRGMFWRCFFSSLNPKWEVLDILAWLPSVPTFGLRYMPPPWCSGSGTGIGTCEVGTVVTVGVFNVKNVEKYLGYSAVSCKLGTPSNGQSYGNLPLLSLLVPCHGILFFRVPVAIEVQSSVTNMGFCLTKLHLNSETTRETQRKFWGIKNSPGIL